MHAVDHRYALARPAAASLARWRLATRHGNLAFQAGDLRKAESHYRAALAQARDRFAVDDDADAGVAAWVIAHHNLADLCEKTGDDATRRRLLLTAHQRLCSAMYDDELPEAWRQAALAHSRRTYAELLRYLAGHPDDAGVRLACQQGAAGPAGPSQ